MKIFKLKCAIITALVIVAIEGVNGQNTAEALAYLNQIGEYYSDIRKETWDYVSAMSHSRSARKVERKRVDLLKEMHKSKELVKHMPAFEKDYSFRDSVVAYLDLSFNVLNNDYDKIIDMEEVAEQSYDLMEAYLLAQELANDKLDQANERLDIQYKAFAENYNITLVEGTDELGKKLEKSSVALKYYNKVYLVFFKAYKQEIYLLDAMSRNDIMAIEQNRNALLSIADEGMAKLSEIGHLKGDNSLNSVCKRMMMFYKDEAENKIPVLSDFLNTAKEFKEMDDMFKSKDRMQLSQAEVDKYNKAVNEYNKGINKYNSLNTNLNNSRNTKLDAWNNTVNSFMERHIPKR